MDRLMFGLSTMLIGILVVFCGLIILILCIYGMTSLTGRSRKPAAQKAAPAPAEPAEPLPVPVQEEAQEETDEQLIAVITAAIAAVWQGQGSGFVVRRVRRNQNSTARARAARDEQIFSRM